MKAEEKTFAFMFFSVVLQFVYSLRKKTPKKQYLGMGEGGGEGQEQRDRRAKCLWRITGNSSNKY